MENKTTSVTIHFKKLTTGNNVFSVSVIVQSNCDILQFLHQMFNVSVLLLDDAFKPVMPLTNGMINEMLRQFVPLSDISQGSVTTHFKCGGMFSDCIIAYGLLIPTVKQFRNRLIFNKFKAYEIIVPFLEPTCM